MNQEDENSSKLWIHTRIPGDFPRVILLGMEMSLIKSSYHTCCQQSWDSAEVHPDFLLRPKKHYSKEMFTLPIPSPSKGNLFIF